MYQEIHQHKYKELEDVEEVTRMEHVFILLMTENYRIYVVPNINMV